MPVCQLLTSYRLEPSCQGGSLRAVTAGWGWGEGFRAEGAMGSAGGRLSHGHREAAVLSYHQVHLCSHQTPLPP